MNIVILGAGRVGESVAESLASEHNDITVIDTDPAKLRHLQDRLDLRGVDREFLVYHADRRRFQPAERDGAESR